MPDAVQLAKRLSIREAGFDELWLRDQIYDNPAALGLGDLEPVAKERQQALGRLDILLMDAEDETMYEVELMLGATDPSHIIRTIEYWDNEKRRWPQHQHYAVLVAEHINRRFLDVIHLLSLSIPIIAVQASMLDTNGTRSLYFSKILDTYEEPDVATPEQTYDRKYWQEKAPWTLEAADALFAKTQDLFTDPKLNYVQDYVAIKVGYYVYFHLHKRAADKSILIFPIAQHLQDEAAALLDDKQISYVRKPKGFRITVDKQMIANNEPVLRGIADLVKKRAIVEWCVLAERKKAAYPAGGNAFFSSAGPTRAERIRHERDYDFRQRIARGEPGRSGSRQLPGAVRGTRSARSTGAPGCSADAPTSHRGRGAGVSRPAPPAA